MMMDVNCKQTHADLADLLGQIFLNNNDTRMLYVDNSFDEQSISKQI